MRLFPFIVGAAAGAALMYLYDPHQGRDRRQQLAEKVRQGRDKFRHEADDSIETGRETMDEARYRARSSLNEIERQASETVDEAQRRTRRTASEAEDRVRSTIGSDRNEADAPGIT
jgi:gas vesicle protein